VTIQQNMYVFVRCQFQTRGWDFVWLWQCAPTRVTDFALTEVVNFIGKINDTDHKFAFTEIWDKY